MTKLMAIITLRLMIVTGGGGKKPAKVQAQGIGQPAYHEPANIGEPAYHEPDCGIGDAAYHEP